MGHEFEGLMRCDGKILDTNGHPKDETCGRAVTGETVWRHYKNGQSSSFTYYRCSSNREKHRCSQRDKVYMKEIVGRSVSYRQDEIEVIFEDIFKSFRFDEEMCKEMTTWLWQEHFNDKEKSTDGLNGLVARKYQLEDFIEKSYEDKLSGGITEEIWKKNTARWSEEHEKIVAEMNTLKEAKGDYTQRGVDLIELMQHSEVIYKNATPEKKRQLVELVSSNLLLKDGVLAYDLKLPFNLLVIKDQKKAQKVNPGFSMITSCEVGHQNEFFSRQISCEEKWGG